MLHYEALRQLTHERQREREHEAHADVWRCRLAVGVTGAHAGWRWQPASGTWPLDAMRPSEPFVSWPRT